MARVYLDQNKWISLLREQSNGNTGNDSSLARLRQFVEETDVVCPMSVIHLIETASASNRGGRVDDMFDLMLELSQNQMMAPFTVVRDEEIDAKVDEMLGRDASMDGNVVGQGLAFSVGGRHYDVVSESGELNEEVRGELLEAVESDWASELLLDDEEIRDSLGSREYEEELVDRLEEIRSENEEQFNDNDNRRRHEVLGYFSEEVIPEVLRKVQVELITAPADTVHLQMDHGISQERLESEEYAFEWIQDFPAIYTHVNLTVERDIQRHRDIQPNDLNDIMALSVAIPYCDVVVTENFWAHIASQVGVDDLYNTEVASDIEEVFGAFP